MLDYMFNYPLDAKPIDKNTNYVSPVFIMFMKSYTYFYVFVR